MPELADIVMDVKKKNRFGSISSCFRWPARCRAHSHTISDIWWVESALHFSATAVTIVHSSLFRLISLKWSFDWEKCLCPWKWFLFTRFSRLIAKSSRGVDSWTHSDWTLIWWDECISIKHGNRVIDGSPIAITDEWRWHDAVI